jgi:DNA-binding NarL/FixJ family response regulator
VEYALSKEEPDPLTTPAPEEPSVSQPHAALTRREREVAALVAQGMSNRQIAQELSISERTAGNHIAKILRKLKLRSRAQIGGWAAERQLRTPQPD